MKIEKLPSGSYRVRKMYKGKVYSVTFECKPTQKEAMIAISDLLESTTDKHASMTFSRAAEEYIESKRNVLSPSTIRGYRGIMRQFPEAFLEKNLYDITALDVQAEINRMAQDHSPKTVRNHHGFISSVLGTFRPNLKLSTTLPQKRKNEPYIPSAEDVRKILSYAKDTAFEVPLILACYGMRRSEICALTVDDIDGDIVPITKGLVQDDHKQWIVKTTKTTSSTRDIIIPMDIADKIRAQGYVFNGYPGKITE